MKNTVFLAVLAAAICFSLPFIIRYTPDASAEAPQAEYTSEETPAETAETESPAETAEPLPPAPEVLTVLVDGEETEMTMREYLAGVVAAEMPASFEEEALCAQAVAARTYAVYCAEEHKHGNADVCTDHSCCQAWKSDDALRDSWGDKYETNLARVAAAVDKTDGRCLSYDGKVIFAAFHSSSAGRTENSYAIWSDIPYLTSVTSPESAADVPNYVSYVSSTAIDFRDTLLSAYPEADFTGEESSWVGALETDESGRVAAAEIGGISIPGTALRTLFALRSAAFSIDWADGIFTFTVTGYGHGIGMSQYGANVMAKNGASYEEILAHYYPNTVLSP